MGRCVFFMLVWLLHSARFAPAKVSVPLPDVEGMRFPQYPSRLVLGLLGGVHSNVHITDIVPHPAVAFTALHRTAASGWSSNWCGDRSGWADGSTLISQLFSILPNVFVIVEQAFLVINKSDPPNKKLLSVPMASLASL